MTFSFVHNMKKIFSAILFLSSVTCFAQTSYSDSLRSFQANYVQTHEVVKGEDRAALQFYPVDKSYRVVAKFKTVTESKWISFPTSGKIAKVFKVYGTVSFRLHGKLLHLNLYQSQNLMGADEYRNYLFLPFTDSTTGNETYEAGRYIDLSTTDIQTSTLLLDFNKAYNPYCAYVSGKYNCPIPPKENALPIAIRAGEKAYVKAH